MNKLFKLLFALLAVAFVACDKQETYDSESPLIENIPEGVEVQYIYSINDLNDFRTRVNSGDTTLIGALRTNLDLEGATWTPIGKYSSTDAYGGTFFGGGYTISNFKIDNSAVGQGLFCAVIGGTIMNLTIRSATISTNDTAGAICGYMQDGTMENCHVIDCRVATSNEEAGGIVGSAKDCEIKSCTNVGTTVSGKSKVGGIAGVGNGGSISGCSNSGTITADERYVDGIVGYQLGDIALSNNTNTGSVN